MPHILYMQDSWKNNRDKHDWRAWLTEPEKAEIAALEKLMKDLAVNRGSLSKARERIQKRATMRAMRDEEQKK